jgi:hypothetical protein
MFAVEVIEHEMLQKLPNFTERMDWILKNKPELAKLVSHWDVEGKGALPSGSTLDWFILYNK